MFDTKKIVGSMLGCAPQFLMAHFSSVILGIVAAYEVLLFFLGHPPFFQRVGELLLMTALGYWGARGTRYGIMQLVCLIEGTDREKVNSPESALSSTPLPEPQVTTDECDLKGLD
ncbi:hypothetical protein JKF63_04270 [Porcisia hertigi]|uniref:Uncharacterized protein n=1 Tax=Porcisia hertigi TaxID=2761500 RepID=A0A836I331_9TRYP|nr:hypothetical protein JKF63_04270 [Porcisia hertigi]